MSGETIFICSGCQRKADGTDTPELGLAAALRGALAEAGLSVRIETPDCMNVCSRPVTIAARAPGKQAYLFADVDPAAGLGDIVAFARLYANSADGTIADARPLGQLRFCLLGRIPPVIE